jgi:competence protein ComEC
VSARAANGFPAPVVFSASGAALAFYILRSSVPALRPPAFFVSIPALGAVVAGAAVLTALGPSVLPESVPALRRVRRWAFALLCFAFGAVLGAAAADRSLSGASWGMDGSAVSGLRGVIASDPRETASGRILCEVELRAAYASGGLRTSARGRVAVFLPRPRSGSAGLPYGRGETYRFSGRAAAGTRGPLFFADSAELEAPAPARERARTAVRRATLERLWTRPWGGLAGALLLGSKDGLEDGEDEGYVEAGCAHVLALSGMHLALFALLTTALLKRPLGLRASAALSLLLMALYVYLAGAQPSLVRALLMYAAGAAALFLNAPRPASALLSAAFLIQLAADPRAALTLSFQLSYLALAGLILVGDAVDDLCRPFVPAPLRGPLAASVGAFVATAGLSAAAFGTLRPVGMLASLVLAPAATAIMAGAGAWLVLQGAAPPAAALVDRFMEALHAANRAVVDAAARAAALPAPSAVGVAFASLAVAFLLVYGRSVRERMGNRVEPID